MKSKPLLLAALAVTVPIGWLLTRPNKETDGTKLSENPKPTPIKSTLGTPETNTATRRPTFIEVSERPIMDTSETSERENPGTATRDRIFAQIANRLLNDPVVLNPADVAYIAVLRERLNLPPEQQKAVQAVFEEQQKNVNAMEAQRFTDTSVPRDLTQLLQDQAAGAQSKIDAIDALLDKDQKKVFAEIRSQEQENRIETQTYAEMQRLQQAVPHLTEEQKDRAFAALSEQIRKRESPDNLEAPPANRLQDILTPEQFQAYKTAMPAGIQGTMFGGGGRVSGLEVITREGMTIIGSKPDKE